MFEFICSTCGKRVQGDDSVAGQRVQCPVCNAETIMPKCEETSTAFTASENALHVKIVSPGANDGAFQEGPPPMPQEPMIALGKQAPHFVSRALPYAIVALVIATLIALCVPAVQKVREAAARTQSVNNLKQIGLGMQSFHDGNRRLPFNGIAAGTQVTPEGSKITYFGNATTDSSSSGSWLFQIYPYVDQTELFHLSGVAGSDVIPDKWRNSGVATYMCPGRGRQAYLTNGGPWNDYHINILLNAAEQDGRLVIGFNVPDVKRTLLGITDGSSNTIFAGHGYIDRDQYATTGAMGNFSGSMFTGGTEGTGRALGVPLPNRFTAGTGPATRLMRDNVESVTGIGYATSPQTWGGPFPQGALFVWCDGTVRMVPYDTPQSTAVMNFGAYLTPTNGEAATVCD